MAETENKEASLLDKEILRDKSKVRITKKVSLTVTHVTQQRISINFRDSFIIVKSRHKDGFNCQDEGTEQSKAVAQVVDILSPAAMINAYYICHNVQVLQQSLYLTVYLFVPRI